MKEINIILEKLMFLAMLIIPVGIFITILASDGERTFGLATMATLIVSSILLISFSILSPLLEIAANTREMLKIANGQNREEPSRVPSRVPSKNLDQDQIADNELFEQLGQKHRDDSRQKMGFN